MQRSALELRVAVWKEWNIISVNIANGGDDLMLSRTVISRCPLLHYVAQVTYICLLLHRNGNPTFGWRLSDLTTLGNFLLQ